MATEFANLTKAGVWVLKNVRERREVEAEAKRRNMTYHFGRVFGICTEKGSELPKNHALRKFKGRYVFQGNQVKDEWFQAAMFEDKGSAPASIEAAKSVDCWGLVEGHISEQCDAEQAYTQSKLKSPSPTWVILPEDMWPDEWRGNINPQSS